MEYQQTVEVLAAPQEPVFTPSPGHWAVDEAVNCQRSPRLVTRLLQVTPATKMGTILLSFPMSPDHKPAELQRSADLICWMSWWMWCGSSSPLMEMLRASLSVVLGSGQTSEDRKLSTEFSLKSQNQS